VPPEAAAVLRFSSLGDVLLAAHMPSFLKRLDPGRRVLFVTKERYGRALEGHPHIDRLYLLEEGRPDPAAPAPFAVRGGLRDLVASMRLEGVRALYDLHGNYRSNRVLTCFPAAHRVTAPKYTLRRRMWVYARWLRPAPVPPILSTYRAAAGIDAGAELDPWLRDALSPEERAGAETRVGSGSFLLFGVGARWRTKRWPLRSFLNLADEAERALGLPARFAVGPEETELRTELLKALPRDRHGTVDALPFRALAAIAARAAAIVSNDSAVLHLGPALAVPAVGVFGSTIPEFGFARQGPRDAAVGVALRCRPCDVHGKSRCPLGHHDCMERLPVRSVLEALRGMRLAGQEPAEGGSG
jgi:ADP-heptose:LPS heptosyltransferase